MFLSHEQIAVSTAVLTVADLTIPANATGAVLQASTQGVRYTMDGSTPSTTVGMLLAAAAPPEEFLIDDLRNIKFIREGASDATLEVHYFAGRDV